MIRTVLTTFTTLIAVGVFAAGSHAAVLADYPFTDGSNATRASQDSDPDSVAGDFTDGPGLTTTALDTGVGNPSPSWRVGQGDTTDSLSGAKSGDDYASITITPATGKQIDFTQFSLDVAKDGPSADNKASIQVEASTNGFSSSVFVGELTGVGGNTSSFTEGDFTITDSALQGVGGATEFRIYIWDAGATSGGVFIDNAQVQGTVIPEPASLGLLGLGGLMMLSRRRCG